MQSIKVLDKGFLRLVDFMGGDQAVVQAARVSLGQGLKGEERDRRLIRYLLKHQHMTPFEHAVFKFHVKCPIFVARQWFRHRWGSYNEISGRYTEFEEEFYLPENFRKQIHKDYKYVPFTGDEVTRMKDQITKFYNYAFKFYRELLEQGVARELARIILPLSLYTQFYWTVNARSLMNFINLRADKHAQWEIQRYALAIAKVFKELMPWTFEAFLDHAFSGESEELMALKGES
jgi:thymidylate synthase (FAD)